MCPQNFSETLKTKQTPLDDNFSTVLNNLWEIRGVGYYQLTKI